jgi:hypothetical protein
MVQDGGHKMMRNKLIRMNQGMFWNILQVDGSHQGQVREPSVLHQLHGRPCCTSNWSEKWSIQNVQHILKISDLSRIMIDSHFSIVLMFVNQKLVANQISLIQTLWGNFLCYLVTKFVAKMWKWKCTWSARLHMFDSAFESPYDSVHDLHTKILGFGLSTTPITQACQHKSEKNQ